MNKINTSIIGWAMIATGENRSAPIINVKHSSLERSDNSAYRSVCPVCQEGTLLVARDINTGALLPEDRCVLCGQGFIYIDFLPPEEKNILFTLV